MKKNLLFTVVTAVAIASSPLPNFGQAPNLGSITNFVLFTTTGAVSSTGVSQISGNVGTGTGAINGFGTLNGLIFNSDAVTTQATADLTSAYNDLNSRVATFFPGPVLGDGQTLVPGVYSLPAAASLNTGLYLDALGDSTSLFIIKIGGAFSTNASSEVFLINGAKAANVFWIVQGAVPMAAGTTMRGTIIANNAAVSMGAGGLLEGRMLSTTGAVSIYGSLAFVQTNTFVLPVSLVSFTGICEKGTVLLKWSTATESNNSYFTIERSAYQKNWIDIKTVEGSGSSPLSADYEFTDGMPIKTTSYYRLKQTDFDGNGKYGNVIEVKSCGGDDSGSLTLYPNPSATGKLNLAFTGDKSQVVATQIFNTLGQKILEAEGFQSSVDLSGKPAGVYFVEIRFIQRTINLSAIVKK